MTVKIFALALLVVVAFATSEASVVRLRRDKAPHHHQPQPYVSGSYGNNQTLTSGAINNSNLLGPLLMLSTLRDFILFQHIPQRPAAPPAPYARQAYPARPEYLLVPLPIPVRPHAIVLPSPGQYPKTYRSGY